MKTLEQMRTDSLSLPLHVSSYLADIGRSQGVQELFKRQSVQKLKRLRENAIIQSAVSSNRIEGVEIEQKRVATVVFGHPALRDRNEEEVAGYRGALELIHTEGARLPLSEETILRLHKMSRGEIWDAGKYKEKPVDIIEQLPAGGHRTRFRSVAPEETPDFVRQMLSLYQDLTREKRVAPVLLLAALNLDFLCIHPFRDGNGRVSRLLLLLACYHAGIEVGRYISLERLIEQNRERYYETLEQCSQGWHEGRHNPWPYIGYLLYILKSAYKEFEERVGQMSSPRGEKTGLVQTAIGKSKGSFSVSDLRNACPGVSVDLIRRTLKQLRTEGKVECLGRGPAARWTKK